jgi:hypothetical protein
MNLGLSFIFINKIINEIYICDYEKIFKINHIFLRYTLHNYSNSLRDTTRRFHKISIQELYCGNIHFPHYKGRRGNYKSVCPKPIKLFSTPKN